jgi:hypothetical protein
MIITKLCPMNKEYNSYHIPITVEQYHKWRNSNIPIQDVMPDLNEYQREFLISGMSYEAQDIFFSNPQDIDLNEKDH